jgi:hypothetical protein
LLQDYWVESVVSLELHSPIPTEIVNIVSVEADTIYIACLIRVHIRQRFEDQDLEILWNQQSDTGSKLTTQNDEQANEFEVLLGVELSVFQQIASPVSEP